MFWVLEQSEKLVKYIKVPTEMTSQSGVWSLCYFRELPGGNDRLMFIKYLNKDTALVSLFFLNYIWSVVAIT